jgi:DNA-binding beta-propeller fold protein YncE
MRPALLARTLVVLVALGGCGAAPPDSALPVDGGWMGDASPRPLAIVGDRVSDLLEAYAIDPALARGAVLSVHEDQGFINEPFDLALSPDGQALYVVLGHPAMYKMGTLLKLRLSDGARLGEAVLGEEPSMIALSSDGARAYVSLFRNLAHPQGPWTDPGALLVVDTASMTVLGQVQVCNAALGVALDEPRGRVWVACLGGSTLALVDVTGAPRLDRMVPLDDGGGSPGSGPAYVVLDDGHAFVTAQESGDLWAFDRATAAFARRITFGADAFPQRMALVGDMLLVCVDYAERIVAVARDALQVVDTIAVPGMRPQGIAVTRDGRFALFTDENDLVDPGRVVRVDLAGLGSGGAHVLDSVRTRIFPQAVIIAP